jgi:hypothetical protein
MFSLPPRFIPISNEEKYDEISRQVFGVGSVRGCHVFRALRFC